LKNIAIIGGGFSGTMTAVQLIKKASSKLSICIIEPAGKLFKGAAYNSYSDKHLLNVAAAKMSGFADQPEHFLNWVMAQDAYKTKDRELTSNSFLPRNIYGNYLSSIWEDALQLAATKGIEINWLQNRVTKLNYSSSSITLQLDNNTNVTCEKCVLATGNMLPRNPLIHDSSVLDNKNYFQNPWQLSAVINKPKNLPVLIIGNGLTMVDTVIGLTEYGFKGTIYAVSPNGFNILPHRHNGIEYKGLDEELIDGLTLHQIVTIINRHIKSVREFGISAEPIVDALRPKVQKHFLHACLNEGIISQDPLKLGIAAETTTYKVKDQKGNTKHNLFTLGSNLKGELWESTAVNELRLQAEKLAEQLLLENQ